MNLPNQQSVCKFLWPAVPLKPWEVWVSKGCINKNKCSVLLVVKQDFLFPLVQEKDKNIFLQKYIQGTQQQNGDTFPSSTQNVKNYREKVQ